MASLKLEEPRNGEGSLTNLEMTSDVKHSKTKTTSAKNKKAKPPTSGQAKKTTSKKSRPAGGNKRPFSDTEIGDVAGQVWLALADEGPMSLSALKKAVDAPEAHILAGIGWLARENKLLFSNQGRTTRLSLQ